MIQKIEVTYFSPTGQTKQVAETIGREVALRLDLPVQCLGFTYPRERREPRHYEPDTLLIIGMPTYAGRIPNKGRPFLEDLFQGDQTLVVPVVTFGNRSYDDSLAELSDVLKEQGFSTISGAAICTHHAFADIGPEDLDVEGLKAFGASVAAKLGQKDVAELLMPGNHPAGPYYIPKGEDGEPAKFLKAKPITGDTCNGCGNCVSRCPMGSIELVNGKPKTPGICIKCQGCIIFCSAGARRFTDEAFLSHKRMLEQAMGERKKSEFYL